MKDFINLTRAETGQVDGGLWLACAQPERPPDAFVVWHYEGCERCQFKALVQQARFPDDTHVTWLCRTMGVAR